MSRDNRLQARIRASFIVVLIVAVWFGQATLPPYLSVSPAASAQTTPAYKLSGIGFSPYIDGQDPNRGTVISEAQLRSRMQLIAGYTNWVRSFGSTSGLEKFGMVAHSLGLKAAVGAWLSRDLSANDREVNNLIAAAQAGHVDLAIVGSEVLLRGDLSESQLIGYINRVKQQIPTGIPVATADVYGELLAHPNIIANSDVVLPNYYPYWEGVRIDLAIANLHRQHQQVVAAAGNKPVIVSETGWPSAGDQVGSAVPSPENAAFYFLNFVSWARANNVPYFYFEAFDESWKAGYEGPQGAHWGVWNKDGVLKPGMQDVFDGRVLPDNWSGGGIPGGPGTPSMEFSYVPPYGSFNNLVGQVLHVRVDDYRVAVYILVGGGWWTKPTFASPLTNISIDGSWECDITTGGVDQTATRIAAYLVPKDFSPPAMSGGGTLPASLDQNSVAKVEVSRSSNLNFIEGRVTDRNNQGFGGVTIALSGSQAATTRTVGNGLYSFINLQPGGNYTVTPSLAGFTFTPPSQTFNNLSQNQTANFAAAPVPPALQFSQSSYTAAEDSSFLNVTVTRSGDLTVPSKVKYATSDATDANFRCNPTTAGQLTGVASRKCDYHIAVGILRFAAGEAAKQLTLSIVNDVYVEGPETFTLALSNPTGATLGQNSIATITITDEDVGPAANPIDQTSFFVRQLYVDLLSREPDPTGWQGWTTRIDQCGQPGQAPPPCDRVTVGGDGFLRSGEFFDRQFFVLRLYRTGLNRILRYDDVGDLAYVSGFLTPEQLELNKQDLVAEMVLRDEFAGRYNPLSNAVFVQTLLQTAGVSVPQSVQDAWITALDNGSKTRAQVFREISERPEVSNRYLHEAQVVSAYYGFFTRNPDAAYLSFLQRLDAGEITLADLANAFINAQEYRQRFGP